MYVFRNVNEAYQKLVVDGICAGNIPTVRSESRNGPVLMIEHPVTVCYTHPRERVLFHEGRDANPFFHLFESLWMLAGREDLKPLQYYVSDFDKYSDDGLTLNGAYGYRWRNAKSAITRHKDQLTDIIAHLKKTPNSRRAVLQMWNVEDDLCKVGYSKDVCCNLSVCFSVRDTVHESVVKYGDKPQVRVLDMTVFNRSNDLIFGMLGANVVHFSFLQEYMASCIGVGVGKYYQVSNNLHLYIDALKEPWKKSQSLITGLPSDSYMTSGFMPFPLVQDKELFDQEVKGFIDDPEDFYCEPFLRDVAAPMALAYRHHKERNYGLALEAMNYVEAEDWKLAGIAWLNRRKTNWEAKQRG